MDVFEALARERSAGRTATLLTVVAVEGSPPSRPGAKMVVAGGAAGAAVDDTGDAAVVAGTLGCSEFDTAGREMASELSKTPALRRRLVFGHGGEQVLEVFAERHDPQPGVIVVSATPVGRALADCARLLERRVQVLDDDPVATLRDAPPGPVDAVVLSDHDAPYVNDVLRVVLAGDAGFVGMLGSRRHAPEVVDRLRDSGVPEEQLARLHSPCGLDIGSRSPQEIALSIAAEIVATERGRAGGPMSAAR